MSALHSAANENQVEAVTPDLLAIQKEIAALREHLASMSKLLVDKGSESAVEAVKRFGETGKETVTRAQASIRDRPLLSVFIAFVLGLVFGRVFARK